jgi:hypothetical protein
MPEDIFAKSTGFNVPVNLKEICTWVCSYNYYRHVSKHRHASCMVPLPPLDNIANDQASFTMLVFSSSSIILDWLGLGRILFAWWSTRLLPSSGRQIKKYPWKSRKQAVAPSQKGISLIY